MISLIDRIQQKKQTWSVLFKFQLDFRCKNKINATTFVKLLGLPGSTRQYLYGMEPYPVPPDDSPLRDKLRQLLNDPSMIVLDDDKPKLDINWYNEASCSLPKGWVGFVVQNKIQIMVTMDFAEKDVELKQYWKKVGIIPEDFIEDLLKVVEYV